MRACGDTSGQSGFTLLEVLLYSVLAATIMATAISMMTTTNRVSDEDRHRALAETTQRRSLEFMKNVLRNAAIDSLEGFGEYDATAQSPRFRRPTGAVDGVVSLGSLETLVWRPAGAVGTGVDFPGDVWLLTAGAEEIAASRVPRGGFLVRQEGRNLILHLTTYQPVRGGRALLETGVATVSMRN